MTGELQGAVRLIAQVMAKQQPQLVRKMILAGTGPPGAKVSTR
jgi:pimeloyl-ACP methyl ester carboxylesterase